MPAVYVQVCDHLSDRIKTRDLTCIFVRPLDIHVVEVLNCCYLFTNCILCAAIVIQHIAKRGMIKSDITITQYPLSVFHAYEFNEL